MRSVAFWSALLIVFAGVGIIAAFSSDGKDAPYAAGGVDITSPDQLRPSSDLIIACDNEELMSELSDLDVEELNRPLLYYYDLLAQGDSNPVAIDGRPARFSLLNHLQRLRDWGEPCYTLTAQALDDDLGEAAEDKPVWAPPPSIGLQVPLVSEAITGPELRVVSEKAPTESQYLLEVAFDDVRQTFLEMGEIEIAAEMAHDTAPAGCFRVEDPSQDTAQAICAMADVSTQPNRTPSGMLHWGAVSLEEGTNNWHLDVFATQSIDTYISSPEELLDDLVSNALDYYRTEYLYLTGFGRDTYMSGTTLTDAQWAAMRRGDPDYLDAGESMPEPNLPELGQTTEPDLSSETDLPAADEWLTDSEHIDCGPADLFQGTNSGTILTDMSQDDCDQAISAMVEFTDKAKAGPCENRQCTNASPPGWLCAVSASFIVQDAGNLAHCDSDAGDRLEAAVISG